MPAPAAPGRRHRMRSRQARQPAFPHKPAGKHDPQGEPVGKACAIPGKLYLFYKGSANIFLIYIFLCDNF